MSIAISQSMIEPEQRFINELIKPVNEKEAKKQAKIQDREAKKQAKLQEKELAKQAKIQEREATKQAKLQAIVQEREAKKQAKIQEREERQRLLVIRKQRVREIRNNYKSQALTTSAHFARLSLSDRRRRAQEYIQQQQRQREEQQQQQERLLREQQQQQRLQRQATRRNDRLIEDYRQQLQAQTAYLLGRGLPIPVNANPETITNSRSSRLSLTDYRRLMDKDKLNATKTKQEELICGQHVYKESECPICFECIGETNNMVLRCGHQVCGDCILHHIQTVGGTKCPVCREQITIRVKGWNPPI